MPEDESNPRWEGERALEEAKALEEYIPFCLFWCAACEKYAQTIHKHEEWKKPKRKKKERQQC